MDFPNLNGLLPRNVQVLMAWSAVLIMFTGLPFAVGRMWKMLKGWAQRITMIDEAVPLLFQMAAQFKTNGGSSVKDKVDKIAGQMDEHAKMFDHVRLTAEEAKKTANSAEETAQAVSRQLHDMMEHLGESSGHILAKLDSNRNAAERAAEDAAEKAALAAIYEAKRRDEPQRVIISNEPDDPVSVHEVDSPQ